ncbi:MAG: PQQ-binding-like beta-propeller repeat protein [Planctomycetota bacterium]
MTRHLLLVLLCIAVMQNATKAADWPMWRGASQNGRTSNEVAQAPIRWSAEKTEGVRWKVPLPGPGNSSPIVVGDDVVVTQFDPQTRDRLVLCFDRMSGRERWRFARRVEKDEWTHPNNPHCTATPAADGSRIVAFLGSAGLVCLDRDGKLLWERRWGVPQHLYGGGPSPVIHEDVCVVTFGPGTEQFYAGLSIQDGKTIWKIEMPRVDAPNPLEGPNAPPLPKETDLKDPFGSWATPMLVRSESGRTELILTMPGEVRAINPATGETYWYGGGTGAQVLISPTFGSGTLVFQSGFALAMKPGGDGELSEEDALWTTNPDPGRIGSSVVVDDRVYGITMNGILDCVSLLDGETLWRERLRVASRRGGSWCSLVADGDQIYATAQDGTTFVFRAGDQLEIIAKNELNELINATPAIADKQVFLRTAKHLWCIETSDKKS